MDQRETISGSMASANARSAKSPLALRAMGVPTGSGNFAEVRESSRKLPLGSRCYNAASMAWVSALRISL